MVFLIPVAQPLRIACSSVLFDLVSSVSVPGPVFDYNEEFTIEGWIYSGASLPSYPDQVLLGVDGSSSNEYRLSIADGGYLQVDWLTVNTCGSGSDITSEIIFEAGTWTHFAFVSPNLVYKNGELVDTLGEDKRGGALEMVRCILETLQVTTVSSDTCTTLDCGKPPVRKARFKMHTRTG